LKEEKKVENADVQGAYFREQLQELNHPHIELIRGRGLLNAIVIGHANEDAAWQLCLQLKENGLLAKPTHGDKIRFAPPLVITREQINDCISIIKQSLEYLS
jgi:ornithine--oxo-acid transaminase